jgi:CHAT domain-containing protein/Tfp pilus assembly protein PilF
MRPAHPGRLCNVLLACLLVSSIPAQDESRKERPAAADEVVLRALAEGFYAGYAKKDLVGFLQLWTPKAPELAARRQAMQKLFADHEKIEAKGLAIRKMMVEGEKAKLRVEVEINAIEVKTGKPAIGLGKMNRVLEGIKADGVWRVWREAAAEEDLAAALALLKTDDERSALLTAEKELVTERFVREINRQGSRLSSQGNYPEALARFGLAQKIAEQIGDKAGIAATLNNIGLIHYLQGDYTQSREHYEKSLAISEAIEDKAGIAGSLRGVGNAQSAQGNNAEALEIFQKSLAISEALKDKDGIAYTLNNLGSIHLRQGAYAQALEHFQKSLAMKEASGDKPGIARTLNNIGIIHSRQGNYTQALGHFQKSLAMRETLGDRAGMVFTLNSIGNVHSDQGNDEQALEHYQKSLAISEVLGNKAGVSGQLANIGVIHFLRGAYTQALEHFQKSLVMKEALGDKLGIALALNNIGDVQFLQGDYAQALEHFQKSRAICEAIGDKDGISKALIGIGSVHYSQGNYALALEVFHQSLALSESLGDKAEMSRALIELGRTYHALNQRTPARRAFEEAIAAIEALRAQVAGGEQEKQRFFENKLDPYRAMVELLVAENQSTAALVYAERAKARVLLDVLRSGRIKVDKAMTVSEQGKEEGFNSQLVSLNTQISRENLRTQPDATRLNDLKAQLQKARLEYEAFQTGLYAAHPELRSQRGEVEIVTPEQARALLPDAKSALLEYVITDNRTYLFTLTGDAAGKTTELKVYRLEIKRKDLDDRVARFRTMLANGNLEIRRPARELYDLLLKPAAAQLDGRTSLVIVPDGALWELPFQALQPDPARYLIEDCAIAYAPSLTALREMIKPRERRKDSADSSTLLAFGNPALGKQNITRLKSTLMDEKLDPLPEAERQVNVMRRIYGAANSKVYIGAEASEERVKGEAEGYRILHLATHGILNNSSPMYSHLLLAQSEGGAAQSGEDGLLEAWEIMKLDLKADLTVLSACDTARGRVGAGEGMIGLSWALFVAGCPTSVVTQWKVDSTSATELMLEFHRQLRSQMANSRNEFSAARALREASLKLRRTAKYRHPFYWAGFVATGKGF